MTGIWVKLNLKQFALAIIYFMPELPDKAKIPSKLPHLSEDLLLHEVYTHGDDAHAQQEVDRPQHQLCVGLLLCHVISSAVNVGISRHKVTEPDSHQADETKVESIKEGPVLPGREDDSSYDDVADEDGEAGGDGDGDEVDIFY